MYMGVVDQSPESEILRELAGSRVLITGLTAQSGVDLARAFADVKTKLIVQSADLAPEVTALVALLSQSAAEIRLYTQDIATRDAALAFAQTSVKAFGGLDTVINLTSISRQDMAGIASERDVDNLIAAKLSHITEITRVTANRMRVILSEGSILNVLTMTRPANGREAAIAGIARTALATMTRGEANAWADQSVRINAIGPRTAQVNEPPAGACLTNEPDIAALALYLASRRGRTLSGHVFDCEGAAASPC
jgi:3-oxoacyl-[acyl-carrier protein] reductase